MADIALHRTRRPGKSTRFNGLLELVSACGAVLASGQGSSMPPRLAPHYACVAHHLAAFGSESPGNLGNVCGAPSSDHVRRAL
jgi:hypothetical protein